MSSFKNEFSWSISRDKIFQTCPRQYYFNYYDYWGGWDINTLARTRQIYILKQLKNRYMWAGAKVHDCIERTLTNLQRGIDRSNYLNIATSKYLISGSAECRVRSQLGGSPWEDGLRDHQNYLTT